MMLSGDQEVFAASKWITLVINYFSDGKRLSEETEKELKEFEDEPE